MTPIQSPSELHENRSFTIWQQETDCLATDIATNQTKPFNPETSPKAGLETRSENQSHVPMHWFDHLLPRSSSRRELLLTKLLQELDLPVRMPKCPLPNANHTVQDSFLPFNKSNPQKKYQEENSTVTKPAKLSIAISAFWKTKLIRSLHRPQHQTLQWTQLCHPRNDTTQEFISGILCRNFAQE